MADKNSSNSKDVNVNSTSNRGGILFAVNAVAVDLKLFQRDMQEASNRNKLLATF